jgi:ferric iron reductase protein FhuF
MQRTTGVVTATVAGAMTPGAPSIHPLAGTLQRGRARTHGGHHLGAALGFPSEDGWVPVARLLSNPRLLEDALTAVGREVGSRRRDVQASLLLEAYAWRLVLPLAGALLAESRIPTPGLDGTAVRLTGKGLPSSVRLLHGRFAALPGDPATGHPDADVVRNSRALDLCLRNWLIAHFDPFVERLNAASGRPRAALWRSVADRTATALMYAGLAADRTEAARAIAERTLTGAPPLCHPPRYTAIGEQPVHLRHGCCLWWRTDAATTCMTCPLRLSAGDRAVPCLDRARRSPGDRQSR